MPMFWVASLATKPWLQVAQLPDGLLGFAKLSFTAFVGTLRNDPGRVLWCARPVREEWFVKAILVCYLAFPLLERLVRGAPGQGPPSRRRLLSILGVAVASRLAIVIGVTSMRARFGSRKGMYSGEVPWLGVISMYAFPLFRLPDFTMGVLIPHLASDHAPAWLCVCSEMVFLALLALSPYSPKGSIFQWITDFQIQAPLWAFALWGFCFTGRPSLVGRILSYYPAWLAKCSYGIYLFHLPVAFSVGFHWARLPLAEVAIIFAFTVMLSWIGATLVEEQVEKFVKAYTVDARLRAEDTPACPHACSPCVLACGTARPHDPPRLDQAARRLQMPRACRAAPDAATGST
eukprot:CAMPEP_0204513156 /NCGR_PEP_ID=MMETSP0661-20131031/1348_1 /ASSEMBLY_ACC=CAM_ASM_000606 /TAXON_ID=109239 /ORGANISM="Alexandrium margalefi, Strain AMGDE01CS-322" /LENGTH=346 /DNA_ID=CAMNT_0051518307 /DNA_START=36 /DNA_END=1073 /DNA_ORIENTATION=-